MSIFHWLVFFSTIGAIVLLWAFFIVQNFSKKVERNPLDEEEERLVELMGRVRVFVDSKVEQLDKKMEEVRELIKELNKQYVSVASLKLEKIENIEDATPQPYQPYQPYQTYQTYQNHQIHKVDKVDKVEGYNFKFGSTISAMQNYAKQGLKNVENEIQSASNFFQNSPESAPVRPSELDHKRSKESIKNLVNSNEEETIEKKIFEMFQNGIEPIQIAKTLKMGVGEVQLIIDLMKRQVGL